MENDHKVVNSRVGQSDFRLNLDETNQIPYPRKRSISLSDTNIHHKADSLFDKYIMKKQLAEHLGVCLSTINNRMNEGMPRKYIGRSVRFWLPDVMTWLHRKENRP